MVVVRFYNVRNIWLSHQKRNHVVLSQLIIETPYFSALENLFLDVAPLTTCLLLLLLSVSFFLNWYASQTFQLYMNWTISMGICCWDVEINS